MLLRSVDERVLPSWRVVLPLFIPLLVLLLFVPLALPSRCMRSVDVVPIVLPVPVVVPSCARVLELVPDWFGIWASRCIVPGVLVVPIVLDEGMVVDELLVDGVVPDVPGVVVELVVVLVVVLLVPVCASIGRAGVVCAKANEAAPAIEAAATEASNNLVEFIRFSNSDFSEQTALSRRESSLMNSNCRGCGMSGRSGVGHGITFRRP